MKFFLLKQLIKSKLKGLPENQQEKILKALEENPELLQRIALEVQEIVREGKDQMSAIMETIANHKDELDKVFGR